MAGYRAIGFSLPTYTTEKLEQLVEQYGPDGTDQQDAIKPGAAVLDIDTEEVKVFNGDDFVPGWGGSEGGGGGGGDETISFPPSTSLVLDQAFKQYDPLYVTGNTTITVSGTTKGAQATMVVVANGTNSVTVAGATERNSSFGFLNSAGVPNMISVLHNGYERVFAWDQQAVPNPIPIPDTTAPAFVSAVVNNSTPNKIVLTYNEALSSTITGTLVLGGPARTVSSQTVVGSTVEVVVNTAYANGDVITITPPAGYVRDAAGNASPTIGQQSVTNNVAPVGGNEDAITTAYRTRAGAAGVTLNENHVTAADTFIKTLRTAGIHTKITRLNLAMNDTQPASLVPFIGSTADTTGNTVTFDPALGWNTTGSSWINTGVVGKAGAFGFGAYLRTTQASDATARPLIGTTSATDNYRIIGNRTPGVAAGSANGAVSNLQGTLVGYAGISSGGLTAGAWHSIRRSATNIELVRNGVSVALNTTTDSNAGAADTTLPMTVMGLNAGTGTPSAFLAANSKVAGYWIDDGTMTISEMQTFYTALQAFQTALGRQV